jgi:hypothetical protein
MVAINFPDSPAVNDIFTSGTKTFKWDGTKWDIIVTASAILTGTLSANGGNGSAGQVLTSGAATNVYWSTVENAPFGGGTDQIFFENDQTVTTSYSITTNKNAITGGPITINSGISVTIPTGSVWTIL